MRFGLTICNHAAYADPSLLADLAVEAESAGWDAVFLWDHIARAGEPAMTDPQIALAAIAARTERVLIGPMVTPLARRRPQKVAREAVALDHLSGGRMVLGVGLGIHPKEFEMLGDAAEPRAKAALLDEAKDYGINVSSAAAEGLTEKVRAERWARWRAENREWMDGYNVWIEEHGLPLAKYRAFWPETD